ncbi:hypothetical protein M9Y10_040892 [Tritrichomonas musculus]|uniref:Uncharacterized protein n=1 Tax=Tritrichomonas musculus TaxID=1915356 RepID=A0ABR2K323_9EUKA
MNSFTELISEMQEDMNDQQRKVDTFARTMFQWLDRISLEVDPNAQPSEFSTCPDCEMYFSNESSSAIAQVSEQASFLSQAEFDISIKFEDTESFHFQPSQRSSIKSNDENASRSSCSSLGDFKSKKVLFSDKIGSQANNMLNLEKKSDHFQSTKDARPYYFGISEYVDELAESAMKFRQKWQSTITQREP